MACSRQRIIFSFAAICICTLGAAAALGFGFMQGFDTMADEVNEVHRFGTGVFSEKVESLLNNTKQFALLRPVRAFADGDNVTEAVVLSLSAFASSLDIHQIAVCNRTGFPIIVFPEGSLQFPISTLSDRSATPAVSIFQTNNSPYITVVQPVNGITTNESRYIALMSSASTTAIESILTSDNSVFVSGIAITSHSLDYNVLNGVESLKGSKKYSSYVYFWETSYVHGMKLTVLARSTLSNVLSKGKVDSLICLCVMFAVLIILLLGYQLYNRVVGDQEFSWIRDVCVQIASLKFDSIPLPPRHIREEADIVMMLLINKVKEWKPYISHFFTDPENEADSTQAVKGRGSEHSRSISSSWRGSVRQAWGFPPTRAESIDSMTSTPRQQSVGSESDLHMKRVESSKSSVTIGKASARMASFASYINGHTQATSLDMNVRKCSVTVLHSRLFNMPVSFTGDIVHACMSAFVVGVESAVKQHQGKLHPLQGDSLFASFNAFSAVALHQQQAVECALKIIAIDFYENIVKNHEKVDRSEAPMTRCVILSGYGLVGAVGNTVYKAPCILGNFMTKIQPFEAVGVDLGSRVVCDASVAQAVQYVARARPVDRIALTDVLESFQVYEILFLSPERKQSAGSVKGEEWMYEVQRSDINDPFRLYTAAWNALMQNEGDKALSLIKQFRQNVPQDGMGRRLELIIVSNMNSLLPYNREWGLQTAVTKVWERTRGNVSRAESFRRSIVQNTIVSSARSSSTREELVSLDDGNPNLTELQEIDQSELKDLTKTNSFCVRVKGRDSFSSTGSRVPQTLQTALRRANELPSSVNDEEMADLEGWNTLDPNDRVYVDLIAGEPDITMRRLWVAELVTKLPVHLGTPTQVRSSHN